MKLVRDTPIFSSGLTTDMLDGEQVHDPIKSMLRFVI